MLLSEEPKVVKTILSFLENYEDWLLERLGVGRQQSLSTSCYSPTSWITITCTFLERVSPAGVQGAAKRIRDWLEQAADFQCVR